MTDAPAALGLRALSKSFGDKAVLREVSLEAPKGEILSLVGESGCGKSTLLRVIAGLERPDAGEVSIDGALVTGRNAFVEPERRRVGYMFQDYALFPHLTVAENLRFGLRGALRGRAEATVAEWLERVGLSGFGARYPHELSGGEQQRVALARALAPEPALLLMDEPFSNLDRRLGARVRERTLAVIRASATTAILVTHDPEEAMASGDRVALMRAGEIVQIGSGEELYRRPRSREVVDFFAPTTALPGRRAGAAVETALGSFPAPAALGEGEPASAFVRASDVRLVGAGDGVPARIVGRSFLGPGYELLLAVDGLAGVLRASTADGSDPLGETVHVCVSPEAVFVFADAAKH